MKELCHLFLVLKESSLLASTHFGYPATPRIWGIVWNFIPETMKLFVELESIRRLVHYSLVEGWFKITIECDQKLLGDRELL